MCIRDRDYAVVGIGINCAQAPEDFPEDIRQIATSLALCTGKAIDRAAVIAQILVALQKMSSNLQDTTATLSRYRQDCITIGQKISLVRGETVQHGVALDVDESGALIVEFADGEIAPVTSGEVSIRGMYGYV